MSFVNQEYAPIPSASSDVPDCLISNHKPRPLPTPATETMYIPSNNATATAGGQLQFVIPVGTNHSYSDIHYEFDLNVVDAGNADLAAHVKFSGTTASGSMLIQKAVSVYAGQTFDDTLDFGTCMDSNLTHGADKSFVTNDCSIMMNSGQTIPEACRAQGGGVNATPLQLSLPCLGFLACTWSKSIPSYIMSGQVTHTVNLASAIQAFVSDDDTTVITNYTVSNARMSIKQTTLEQSYCDDQRYLVNSGNVYNYEYQSYLNVQASGTSINYTNGLNYESLDGVFLSCRLTAKTGRTNHYSLINNMDKFVVHVDNRTFCYPLTYLRLAEMYVESQKVFGKSFDSNITSYCDRTTYQTQGFMVGTSLKRFNDNTLTMSGEPCRNLRIVFTNSDNAYTYYISIINTQIAVFLPGGACKILGK